MDCFYAAVETKYRPELKGKPVGVGGPANSRGVLCTANYEARRFGVRSAMPSSRATRMCPDLILIPPNFSLYRQESQAVRAIFADYTRLIEPLSLDEAYLDVSQTTKCEGSATRIAQEIRGRIQRELGLTASAGIAPNKFLAKVASDWNKPNGQFVIRPSDVAEFVARLKVEKIWGVGPVTAKKMHALGLRTCADIQSHDLFELSKWFGSRARELSDLARGVDDREVKPSRERKSLTVECTYDQDLTTLEECLAQITELYDDWEPQMRRAHERSRIRGIVVKIRFDDFKVTTHERVCREWPTEQDFALLLEAAWNRRARPVRLLGLGARLENRTALTQRDSGQLSFF